jgi:succinyl-CoA:acetate CoA-transferase
MDETLKKRIRNEKLWKKVVSPEVAAKAIQDGDRIGTHGATFCGYPKATFRALAERIKQGEKIKVQMWSASLVGEDADGALAACGGTSKRLGSHADTTLRAQINNRQVLCNDIRGEMLPQYVQRGVFGKLDVAVIDAAAIDENGNIIPSASPADACFMVQSAKKVIVEIDHSQPLGLEGFHDIYPLPPPPGAPPIPLRRSYERIGKPFIPAGFDRIDYIVESKVPQKLPPKRDPDEEGMMIARNLLAFFRKEVAAGRLGKNLLPLESGLGNVADAVLRQLGESEFEDLEIFTAVIGDSALDLADKEKLKAASGCACFFSSEGWERFCNNLDRYRERIIFRPLEITNSPELCYRLGVIGLNGVVEMDIYGHINSSHIMGNRLLAGVGGAGVFASNGTTSIFLTPSSSGKGKVSAVVPMVSHVDITEHNVDVVVTEQGYADLRGMAPHERAIEIIEKCSHPDFRPLLMEYFRKAEKEAGGHEPHLLAEAFSFHERFKKTGSMK